MIELSHITKCFNADKANEYTAVNDVSLTIEPGKMTVLKGPSGSGKTTLLAMIGCMSRPTSGRIVLRGVGNVRLSGEEREEVELTSLPERFLTGIRRSTFGFIFQQFNLVKGISVLENVLLPAYPTGERHAALRERGEELLRLFNVARHASSPVEWLSGGEMQRVAIARALINNPTFIVADEPTAHLDSRLSREFMEVLASCKEQGKTILVASHDPIVYDSPLADAVVEVRDGRITAGGEAS